MAECAAWDLMGTDEQFVPIVGYENYYLISNYGRVYSLRTKKCLTWTGGVYPKVVLSVNQVKVNKEIHRLVAEHFIPNPDNLPQVNHKDEDKWNPVWTNLEWCTAKYNRNYGSASDKIRHTTGHRINQYDLDGNFIQQFPSIKAAERATGASGSISHMIDNPNREYANGFLWRRAEVDLL